MSGCDGDLPKAAKRAKVASKPAAWEVQHAVMWKQVPTQTPRWSQEREMMLVSGARERDLVDLCWALEFNKGVENLFIDLSQTAGRKPWSRHLRSMVMNSAFFSYELQRQLIGREHLMLLGFSKDAMSRIPPEISDNQIKGLAGEAMGLPSVAAVMVAAMTAIDELWAQS